MFHVIYVGDLAIHFLTFFTICLVLTGGIKAAQFFFHVWLPDAMEAPTPASALIHSSTLVVAGVFLVIRFSILFEFALYTNYFLVLLGSLTLSFGSIAAVFQSDIKKLVAYSTISQIGYLVCGCGFCCYEEVLLYLIVHALNKAFLFVIVGYTVHYFNGNTDMRFMGGSYRVSFDLAVMLLGASINLAGFPYSAGFLGKELLVFHTLRDDFVSYFVRGCWVVSFFFTPIYMFSLLLFVYFGPSKTPSSTLRGGWVLNQRANLTSLYQLTPNLTSLTYNSLSRFQLTFITSRPTVYILLFVWTFFYTFGDFLLSSLFNYNSLIDTIPSGCFTFIKTHTLFMSYSLNVYLGDTIFIFIIFFLTSSLFFLFNLRFVFSYNYYRINWYQELSLVTIFILLVLQAL